MAVVLLLAHLTLSVGSHSLHSATHVADFERFLHEADSATYDVEAASILRGADSSMHEFVAMLEEAEDDSLNFNHLASVFLQLPAPVFSTGDIDDGGPEGVRSLGSFKLSPNAPVPATLGHAVADSLQPQVDLAKELMTSLAQVSQAAKDASVLGSPNKPGSSFSSQISPLFSDSTTNLASLTKSVDDIKFRLDQLQNYVKRRLKCRVNPESCVDATPARVTKPKEECNHRWKYLCRTTFELTPGASSAATGGAAEMLLVQQHAETLSGPGASTTIAKPKDIPAHLVNDPEQHQAYEKLVEEQRHQIEQQSDMLEKLMRELEQLKADPSHNVLPLQDGSLESTGAHEKGITPEVASEPSEPVQSVAAQPIEQVIIAPTVVEPQSENHVTLPQAVAEQATEPAPVDAVPAQQSSEHISAPVLPDPANTIPSPTESSPEAAVVPAVPEPTAVETAPETVVAQVSTPTMDALRPIQAVQLAPATPAAPAAPVPHVDQSVQIADAIKQASAKQEHAHRREVIHSRALKWAELLQSTAGSTKDRKRVQIPSHLNDLVSLAQFDEGVGASLPGLPDSEFITHMASVAYQNQQQGQRYGIQSLAELDEGTNRDIVTLDEDVIQKLAQHAAEQRFGVPRQCVQKDHVSGICELFDDGSRCLRTDASHALCGFVEGKNDKGDLKRNFSVVDLDSLK